MQILFFINFINFISNRLSYFSWP